MTILPYTKAGLKKYFDDGYNIEVGEHSYGIPRLLWNHEHKNKYSLRIGDYCSIAEGLHVYVGVQGRHPLDFVSTYPLGMIFPHTRPPAMQSRVYIGNFDTTIGSDVWIGRDSLILAGVKIGHGAVIGARSVITKDVAPYMIVGGVPAKPIRSRFDEPTIEKLLEVSWWNYEEEFIKSNVDIFQTSDIKTFVEEITERRNVWLSWRRSSDI